MVKKLQSFFWVGLIAVGLCGCTKTQGAKDVNIDPTNDVVVVKESDGSEKIAYVIEITPSDKVTRITDDEYDVNYNDIKEDSAWIETELGLDVDNSGIKKIEYAEIDSNGTIGAYCDEQPHERGFYMIHVEAYREDGDTYEKNIRVNITGLDRGANGHEIMNYGVLAPEDFQIMKIGASESNVVEYCEGHGTRIYGPSICYALGLGTWADGQIDGNTCKDAVTRRGISLGSSYEDVIAAYGYPYWDEAPDEDISWLTEDGVQPARWIVYNLEYIPTHHYRIGFYLSPDGYVVYMYNETYWEPKKSN